MVVQDERGKRKGALNGAQLSRALRWLGVSAERSGVARVTALIECFDATGDGLVSYRELAEWANEFPEGEEVGLLAGRIRAALLRSVAGGKDEGGEGAVKRLRAVFDEFDVDGSGKITSDELHAGLQRLGVAVSSGEASSLFERLDRNGDGSVDASELEKFVGARKFQARLGARLASEARRVATEPAPGFVRALFGASVPDTASAPSEETGRNPLALPRGALRRVLVDELGCVLSDRELQGLEGASDVNGDGMLSLEVIFDLAKLPASARRAAAGRTSKASSAGEDDDEDEKLRKEEEKLDQSYGGGGGGGGGRSSVGGSESGDGFGGHRTGTRSGMAGPGDENVLVVGGLSRVDGTRVPRLRFGAADLAALATEPGLATSTAYEAAYPALDPLALAASGALAPVDIVDDATTRHPLDRQRREDVPPAADGSNTGRPDPALPRPLDLSSERGPSVVGGWSGPAGFSVWHSAIRHAFETLCDPIPESDLSTGAPAPTTASALASAPASKTTSSSQLQTMTMPSDRLWMLFAAMGVESDLAQVAHAANMARFAGVYDQTSTPGAAAAAAMMLSGIPPSAANNTSAAAALTLAQAVMAVTRAAEERCSHGLSGVAQARLHRALALWSSLSGAPEGYVGRSALVAALCGVSLGDSSTSAKKLPGSATAAVDEEDEEDFMGKTAEKEKDDGETSKKGDISSSDKGVSYTGRGRWLSAREAGLGLDREDALALARWAPGSGEWVDCGRLESLVAEAAVGRWVSGCERLRVRRGLAALAGPLGRLPLRAPMVRPVAGGKEVVEEYGPRIVVRMLRELSSSSRPSPIGAVAGSLPGGWTSGGQFGGRALPGSAAFVRGHLSPSVDADPAGSLRRGSLAHGAPLPVPVGDGLDGGAARAAGLGADGLGLGLGLDDYWPDRGLSARPGGLLRRATKSSFPGLENEPSPLRLLSGVPINSVPAAAAAAAAAATSTSVSNPSTPNPAPAPANAGAIIATAHTRPTLREVVLEPVAARGIPVPPDLARDVVVLRALRLTLVDELPPAATASSSSSSSSAAGAGYSGGDSPFSSAAYRHGFHGSRLRLRGPTALAAVRWNPATEDEWKFVDVAPGLGSETHVPLPSADPDVATELLSASTALSSLASSAGGAATTTQTTGPTEASPAVVQGKTPSFIVRTDAPRGNHGLGIGVGGGWSSDTVRVLVELVTVVRVEPDPENGATPIAEGGATNRSPVVWDSTSAARASASAASGTGASGVSERRTAAATTVEVATAWGLLRLSDLCSKTSAETVVVPLFGGSPLQAAEIRREESLQRRRGVARVVKMLRGHTPPTLSLRIVPSATLGAKNRARAAALPLNTITPVAHAQLVAVVRRFIADELGAMPDPAGYTADDAALRRSCAPVAAFARLAAIPGGLDALARAWQTAGPPAGASELEVRKALFSMLSSLAVVEGRARGAANIVTAANMHSTGTFGLNTAHTAHAPFDVQESTMAFAI